MEIKREQESELTKKKRAAGVYDNRHLTPEQLSMLNSAEKQRYDWKGFVPDPARDGRAPEEKNPTAFMFFLFVSAVLCFISWFALASSDVDYVAGSKALTIGCVIVTTLVTAAMLIYLIRNTKRSQ